MPDKPETPGLDPDDWNAFHTEAHAALDAAIGHLQNRQDAPVWQAPPEALRAGFRAALPWQGQPEATLTARITTDILPYDVGNTHPRFFGWVHGSGAPADLIPEIFASAMNANLGGRDHMANLVEHQVLDWCRDIFGFPAGAGGLIVSGTSLATVIAIKAARDKQGGLGLRKSGLAQAPSLVGYASSEAHSCVARAFDILGLGQNALRKIPVDAAFRMDMAALETAIAADRAAGHAPFCVIGTAGSVNMGAIDPLNDLADLAARENLWFHIDGAFGALGVLSPAIKPCLAGLERADSLAFDFHKWMHVTYDAGCVLIRDAQDQLNAFSERPDYLAGATRGLAAGNPWFCEFGPELSRSFRALKIWYHISHFGLTRIGENIAKNCAQARYLESLIDKNPRLELLAPVALNITCFRYRPEAAGGDPDALNSEIVLRLQETGIAAPSTTRVNGDLAIRVNITNHRTRLEDLDLLVNAILEIGESLG
jgi:aromatic-L-amino-acid decarboxylase